MKLFNLHNYQTGDFIRQLLPEEVDKYESLMPVGKFTRGNLPAVDGAEFGMVCQVYAVHARTIEPGDLIHSPNGSGEVLGFCREAIRVRYDEDGREDWEDSARCWF